MKNYELLGHKWEYYKPLPEILQEMEADEILSRDSHSAEARSEQIQRLLEYPAFQHLGFGPIDGVREKMEYGVDLAIEYFCSNWWLPEEIKRICQKEVLKPFLEQNPDLMDYFIDAASKAMDKSRPDRELEWFDAYTSALIFGGLVGRWDDLGRISSWFDATIEPEYSAGTMEDEYYQLFVCIAGGLSPTPMEGAAELLAKVKKCRAKRVRLLCAAWEAAQAADQKAFDKAFLETVKHYLSKPEDGQMHTWLALHQSAVWLIAEHRGLKLPPLSEKQAAAVLTRHSTGLAE
jgi:hypothetical protein